MPVQKLAINEKDKGAKKFGDKDFCCFWVSDGPFSRRNADARVRSNQSDNGFEHLNIAEIPPIQAVNILPLDLSAMGPEQEKEYLHLVHDKLVLTKVFLKKEKELSLSPHRPRIHKEGISSTLAESPIKISFQAQHFARLLLDTDAELRRLNEEAPEDEVDALLEEPMREYMLFWDNLKAILVWQVPGEEEGEKYGRVEKMMDEVFEKLVEL